METYQGWANYPTWAISLWLNNDQGSQEWLTELVADADDLVTAADTLREHYTEAADDALPANSELSDILGWAMEIVDWREIVATFVAE